jgi:hypothetical protein
MTKRDDESAERTGKAIEEIKKIVDERTVGRVFECGTVEDLRRAVGKGAPARLHDALSDEAIRARITLMREGEREVAPVAPSRADAGTISADLHVASTMLDAISDRMATGALASVVEIETIKSAITRAVDAVAGIEEEVALTRGVNDAVRESIASAEDRIKEAWAVADEQRARADGLEAEVARLKEEAKKSAADAELWRGAARLVGWMWQQLEREVDDLARRREADATK